MIPFHTMGLFIVLRILYGVFYLSAIVLVILLRFTLVMFYLIALVIGAVVAQVWMAFNGNEDA